MIGHEYMTQQVVADHRAHLHQQAEIHRVCRDALAPSRRTSLATRLARVLARPRPASVQAPTVRTTPIPGAAPTS